MYKYRISITFLNPKETLDYYIAAESDQIAKKYFLTFMIDTIKKEQLVFDQISFNGHGFEVLANYKGDTYVHGCLSCLPKKYPKVSKMEGVRG